jgi:hypothetical protein
LTIFWLGNFIDQKFELQWPIFLVMAILLSVFGSLWYLIKKTSK